MDVSIRLLIFATILLLPLVAFVTSLFANVIACEGRCRDKGPLELGRQIWVANRSELTSLFVCLLSFTSSYLDSYKHTCYFWIVKYFVLSKREMEFLYGPSNSVQSQMRAVVEDVRTGQLLDIEHLTVKRDLFPVLHLCMFKRQAVLHILWLDTYFTFSSTRLLGSLAHCCV